VSRCVNFIMMTGLTMYNMDRPQLGTECVVVEHVRLETR
jgi:hypothetical protein